MIKAVIFDMGGVFLHTVDPTKREQMATRYGTTRAELENSLFMSPSSIESELGLISEEEHWLRTLQQYGHPEDSFREAYEEFFSGDGIDQELKTYASSLKPKYKIGLLSNAWKNSREDLSHYFDFLDIFDISIFSSEVGLRKPDERFYRMILKRLDVKSEESIFVDDFPENVVGAAKLGFRTVHFINTRQTIAEINRLLKRAD
jgi:epoxide hydrolase-like predicted phosphatase